MKVIKCWKPNLFQMIMYKLNILKDPRYNGKRLYKYYADEPGQMECYHPYYNRHVTEINLGWYCSHKSDGRFWFRIFGYGLNFKDVTKHTLLFSERNSYTKYLKIGKWCITFLDKYDIPNTPFKHIKRKK